MLKIKQKVSSALIVGICLVTSTGGSKATEYFDDYLNNTIESRNCHECPEIQTLIDNLKKLKTHELGEDYKALDFVGFKFQAQGTTYRVTGVRVERTLWNLWGLWEGSSTYTMHRGLSLGEFKLTETKEFLNHRVVCTYKYQFGLSGTPIFLDISYNGSNE